MNTVYLIVLLIVTVATSEVPLHTRFFLTGLQTFGGGGMNHPTEPLMNSFITDYIQKDTKQIADATIVSCMILEASGAGSLEVVKKMLESSKTNETNVRNVFVHFGIEPYSTYVTINDQARNAVHFTMPDQRGWQPVDEKIVPDHEFNEPLSTTLNVFTLQQDVQNQSGRTIAISHDSEYFVCNWVYYHLLYLGESTNTISLLVHVPSIRVIDQQTQYEIAQEILIGITKQF